ncbi:M56 family metallopeptidase [Pinibacter aurantiacus]|uniref:TonB-dependent receptor plug domain-containing protein n=1 Tax=Pinibacter aurantiacus TaxID=2851599 RepID=A0A9E2S418_9BACT|nr:M56 family metallopeptidase [Pinibacter aurantiacus]MBV4356153.1 TonB-dependent receptor plug domain-containing protein [Pinibacter aurantiacus]
MTAIALYLLKMLVCSGILSAYYFACLQNKLFHQWNRFYLLLTVIFSVTFPLLYIPIFDFNESSNTVGQMVYKVSSSELLLLKNQTQTLSFFDLIVYGAYCLAVFIFLLLFVFSLYKIYSLKKKSTFIQQSDINIYQTNASQAPFSFFKNIFWKQSINLQSTEGQQILKHELVHVHEKHSVDKVFMQLVLSVFWINPFFWLIKKELTIIHEFIADKKSVGSNDASVLAALILTTAYSSGRFDITNQFFHSSIKRRITMVTKNKDPRFSYIRRIAALFVLLATLGMLAFRSKDINETNTARSAKDTSINAIKALELDWFRDKDTSAIIYTLDKKRVKYSDVSDLTTDQVESVHSYVEKRNGNNVIIIDLTLVDPKRKGSVPMIPSNPLYYIDGKEATKADLDKLGPVESITVKTWKGEDAIKKFGDKGKGGVVEIVTKQANPKNLEKDTLNPPGLRIRNVSGKTNAPLYILDGKEVTDIENINPNDIESVTVWKDAHAIEKYGDKGKNGVIDIRTKKAAQPGNAKEKNFLNPPVPDAAPNADAGQLLPPTRDKIADTGMSTSKVVGIRVSTTDRDSSHSVRIRNTSGKTNSPLYILDGKEVKDIENINPNDIESITVWKDAHAIEKYGDKGKNGVIDIKTKKATKPALIP